MCESILKKRNRGWIKAVLINFILAAAIFIPFIIAGKGIFYYMGDYNAQQIPFYVHCHDMIRNGKRMWDFSTELGNNFFASYTYYTLCSPFFWLMIPFPTSWVSYLMGPMYILKFTLTGLTSYAYIRYFTKTNESAIIGSILYTFSGWSVFNIFYNQFHESFIVFPLLLLALEKLVNENKQGFFGLMVAICAITNYYFFVGMVVFTIIYWTIKTVTHSWQMNFKKFGRIVLEAIFGCLAAMFVLIPSAITVFSMSRTGTYINGWNLFFYADTKTYFYIIQSMFFPAEIPAIQAFTSCKSVAWQSLSLYLPLVGITGVLTYLKSYKKDWKSKLLIVSFVMALVPGLNALFTALQNVYYARWFMMPILIMAMVTAVSMDDFEIKDFVPSFKKVSLITVLIVLIVALTPNYYENKWVLGIWNREDKGRFYLFVFFSLIAFAQLLILFSSFWNKTGKINHKSLLAKLIPIILIVSITTVGIGSLTSENGKFVKKSFDFEDITEGMDLEDNSRVSVFDNSYNLAVINGTNCTTFFNSLAPEGTVKTYNTMLDFDRTVISPVAFDYPYFKTITSVKYTVHSKDYLKNYVKEMSNEKEYIEEYPELREKYGDALIPGYKEIESRDEDYKTYENICYLPMGIYYDKYIKESDYKKLNKEQKGRVMINALVIPDSDEAKYQNIASDYASIVLNQKNYSDTEYISDCQNKVTCLDYSEGKNSFTATAVTDKPTYVMFSVAQDNNGWTAKINGKETEVLTVDGGFMAVKVEAGENHIEFNYEVPGLKLGVAISLIGFVGMCLMFVPTRKKKEGN